MKNDGSTHQVRFGPYKADFHTQELWHGDNKLKLAGQPFQILEMLVSNPGQLVTREDLQRRLWPQDHFGDASHGLNAAINKLRDILNDSADQPRYIETLPRRGYRFIGAVEPAVQAVQADSQISGPVASIPGPPLVASPVAEITNPIAIPPTQWRWPIIAVASAALVAGGVIGIAFTDAIQKPAPQPFARLQEAVLTEQREMAAKQETEQRIQKGFAEENRVQGSQAPHPPEILGEEESSSTAHLPAPSEVPALLQTADFRTIVAGAAGNAAPQFSPDGQRIAFMSNRSGPWQIWVSNADGSHPVQVSFTASAGTPRWSPDGQSIAFDAPQDWMTCVFIAPIHDPESAHPVAEGRVPSFSRDGKFVYFASDRTGDWQVWKVPVAGGPEVQITSRGGFAALESADGNLYYAKSAGSNPEIWKIPVQGGVESALSPFVRPRMWSSWTVTKDGILLAVDLPDGKTHLSLYDPIRATIHELVSLQSAPRWMGATSDGKKVVINDAAERRITMLDNLR